MQHQRTATGVTTRSEKVRTRTRRAARWQAAITAAAGATVFAGVASGASIYWTGGNGSWADTSRWSTSGVATTPNPALVPGIADDVIFNVSTQNVANAVTVDAFQFVNSMTFTNSGTTTLTAGILNGVNPFAFNLGNASLGTGGIFLGAGTGQVRFGDGVTASNDVLLTLFGRQNWSNASSSSLVVAAVSPTSVVRNTGATVTFNNSGTGRFVASSNVLQNTNGIVGPWAFTGTGPGSSTRYATNVGGTMSVYTGTSVTSNATTGVFSVGAIPSDGTANLELTGVGTFAASGSYNTLRYQGASGTLLHNGLSLNGIINANGNSLTITNTATASPSPIGATRELIINSGQNNSGVTLATNFTNNASGASSLVKTGAGTLTINSSQSFTGSVFVTQGLMTIARPLSSGVGMTVSAGATVSFNGTSQTFGALNGGGLIDSIPTSTATDTLTVGSGNTNGTFDGNISNSSVTRVLALTKTGTGLQTLTGTNTYRGATTLSGGGTLHVALPVSLPGTDVPGRIVLSNGFLVFRAGDGANGFTSAQIDSTLANATKTAGGIGIDTVNGDLAQWGPLNIPVAFGFQKFGQGTFTLNQPLSVSGTTSGAITVRAGTLAFTGTASVSQAANGSVTLGVAGVSGGALSYGSSAASTFGNIIVSTGTVAQSTFTQTGGTITATSLTLNNGFSGVGQGAFNLSGGTFNVGTLTGSQQVAGDNVFSVITVSGGSLNVSGVMQLTGTPAAGRYGASRVIQSGGTVTADGGLMLARTTLNNAAARRGEYNLDGGQLVTSAVSQDAALDTFGTFNFNGGTLVPTTPTASFFQGVTLVNVRDGGAKIHAATTIDVTVAQPLTHSTIAGDAALDGGLTKSGEGVLTLTANNTYTGPTVISGGTLRLGAGSSSGSVGAGAIVNSGTLVSERSDPVSFTQSISGPGALVHAGTSSVTLGGSLAFTGDTTVSGSGASLIVQSPLRPVIGSLVVTGPGASASLAAAPTTLAASGYTVVGEFASITVGATGTVSVPVMSRTQNKASVLVTGGLTLAAGGLVDLGTSDLIVKGGTPSLGSLRLLVATGSIGASGTAAPGVAPYTTLAVFPNNTGPAGDAFFGTYDGIVVTAADVIIKYTYVGDTDLDGSLTAHDLANVIEGFSNGYTGWQNGDVDHSGGAVSASDVNAFLTAYTYFSSNTLPGLGNGTGGTTGGSGAVPEPSSAIGTAVAVALLGTRRRRTPR